VLDPFRRGVAEFIGTFTLIFAGAGSIMTAGGVHDPTVIGIAIAHGLAIAVMVSAVGHISGGHFNTYLRPARTRSGRPGGDRRPRTSARRDGRKLEIQMR
jgi:glycerol uptake facilitator-like aquaporin